MRMLSWIVAGGIGGLIGAAIWAAIGYFANFEIGWIAWGIGFLVGIGVRMGAGSTTGPMLGVGAVVIAIASIGAGKFAVAWLAVDAYIAEGGVGVDQEVVISYIADAVAMEFDEAGTEVAWPSGVNPNEAAIEPDYPVDIWSEAEARWAAMDEQEQTAGWDMAQSNLNAAMSEFRSDATMDAFIYSFGLFDLLWVFLAVGTAFKVGAGSEEESDVQPVVQETTERGDQENA